ncbi:MAG: TraR/DksA C4-type zinc finger protein [Oscillospiraceae bacterium]|nr:TraR/DksA C4-type zinc finger protein [Oscillospiraceae bacterium]
MDYNRYKKSLIDEKNSIINRVNDSKEDLNNHTELSYYDNHPADTGSDLYQMEKDIILNSRDEDTLQKIDIALNRMENGTYGFCEICGARIPEERLEIIPYTNICEKCQNEEYKYTAHKANLDVPIRYLEEFDVVKEFNSRDKIYEDDDGLNSDKFHGNINSTKLT